MFAEIFGSLLHQFFIIFAILIVTAVNQKGIRFRTAGITAAALCDHAADHFGDAAENFVAILLAVTFVDDMKLIDVHKDSVHGELFIAPVKLVGIAEKVFPVVEACERIFFRRLNQYAVFEQFYGTFYPGKDDFRHGIGLGDKIAGAQQEAGHFRLMVGGQYNDGNLLHFFVAFDQLQQIQSVHTRHDQIQQDQGQLFPVVPNGSQRLIAVLGIQNFIFF